MLLLAAPSYFFRTFVMALANWTFNHPFSLFFSWLMVASSAPRGMEKGDAGIIGRADDEADDAGVEEDGDAADAGS